MQDFVFMFRIFFKVSRIATKMPLKWPIYVIKLFFAHKLQVNWSILDQEFQKGSLYFMKKSTLYGNIIVPLHYSEKYGSFQKRGSTTKNDRIEVKKPTPFRIPTNTFFLYMTDPICNFCMFRILQKKQNWKEK